MKGSGGRPGKDRRGWCRGALGAWFEGWRPERGARCRVTDFRLAPIAWTLRPSTRLTRPWPLSSWWVKEARPKGVAGVVSRDLMRLAGLEGGVGGGYRHGQEVDAGDDWPLMRIGVSGSVGLGVEEQLVDREDAALDISSVGASEVEGRPLEACRRKASCRQDSTSQVCTTVGFSSRCRRRFDDQAEVTGMKRCLNSMDRTQLRLGMSERHSREWQPVREFQRTRGPCAGRGCE